MHPMQLSTTNKAKLAGIIANIFFGLSFLASKTAMRYCAPSVLLTARFILSTIVLLIVAKLGAGELHLAGKPIIPLILLGLCQPVAYFICENYGILYSTSTFSGIMIGLVPAAAALAASFFLKEKIPPHGWAGLFCCAVGIVLISFSENQEGTVTWKGVLFLSGAVVTAALFNVLSKHDAALFSPMERTFVMFVVGSAAFLLISLVQYGTSAAEAYREAFSHPDFVIALVYLAVFSSVIGFFFTNYAVSYLTVRQSTSFTNLSPIVSTAAGALLLHESITAWHILGIVLILWGIGRVNR